MALARSWYRWHRLDPWQDYPAKQLSLWSEVPGLLRGTLRGVVYLVVMLTCWGFIGWAGLQLLRALVQ